MRRRLDRDEYKQGILSGDRVVLGKAITVIESEHPEDQALAAGIMEDVLTHSGKSMRIGITGVPGVGKSTFIEAIGTFLTQQGHKVAVLAIDPSSQRSGGSILGDKTRMEHLSTHPQVFIRPTPAGNNLGGVAVKTRETILLCESAGYDVILIETVGVGQSEVAVKNMTDFFLLLMLAGAGDELQGIKKGIMEMADLIAITKADGDNATHAQRSASEYQNALHLFPPHEHGWNVPVQLCSAVENQGLTEIWEQITAYFDFMQQNGKLQAVRTEQQVYWFHEMIRHKLMSEFYHHPQMASPLEDALQRIRTGEQHPKSEVEKLWQWYRRIR